MSRFGWPARVYWEDTDAGGIVYYANYLRFLERARTEWLRAQGISQQLLVQEQNVLFTVIGLQVHYHQPARLDDLLWVDCDTRRDGGASIAFEQQIWRQSPTVADARPPTAAYADATDTAAAADAAPRTLLLTASVRAACLDARTMKPRRLPEVILRGLAEA